MAASGASPPLAAFIRELTAGGPVITDGAWGTELQARGLPAGTFPDAWNLTRPEQVAAVAEAYVQAGSRVILTNTFGANRLRLAESGLECHVRELNREGVAISRRAAQGRAYVFASLGPSGKMLLTREVTVTDLEQAFAEQARALADAGADAIVVETMTDIEEAKAAVGAARATGLPVVACLVFDSGKNKDRTMMGLTPEQGAAALAAAGADVIGANCGQGIAAFVPLCQRLKAATDRPLWIKPNAGLPQLVDGQTVYRTAPAEFAAHAAALLAAGASFLGGCCGTNPEFIRALRQVVDRRPPDLQESPR